MKNTTASSFFIIFSHQCFLFISVSNFLRPQRSYWFPRFKCFLASYRLVEAMNISVNHWRSSSFNGCYVYRSPLLSIAIKPIIEMTGEFHMCGVLRHRLFVCVWTSEATIVAKIPWTYNYLTAAIHYCIYELLL